ncbi:type II toxin-antitoxin system VapC family toxin [Halocella sp. SP3-1]|uniref:type II toxin-antitoxin system VapC family toxin n=1 Tax=Halocella sp. SP3-1 TaxID=2382161 RepID=UPI000F75AA50|nr:type II toxin-antitoxin system VapC family toxin [Halocella sp. SP3-1]AZO93768.1 PIN domain-containing protein [Halocella sp. SP3-1]
MIITIDVSAAVEIVMGRPKQKILIDILKNADWIIAPSLYIYEAANVMWKYHSIQNYPIDDLLNNTRHMIDIVDQFIKSEDIYEEAIPLSCKIDHPAYDAMYLVTCRRKNSTLITLDKRLIKLANKLDISVASIG